MSTYITCRKRVNQPLIHVLVCEQKCEEKETCKEYKHYLLSTSEKEGAIVSA